MAQLAGPPQLEGGPQVGFPQGDAQVAALQQNAGQPNAPPKMSMRVKRQHNRQELVELYFNMIFELGRLQQLRIDRTADYMNQIQGFNQTIFGDDNKRQFANDIITTDQAVRMRRFAAKKLLILIDSKKFEDEKDLDVTERAARLRVSLKADLPPKLRRKTSTVLAKFSGGLNSVVEITPEYAMFLTCAVHILADAPGRFDFSYPQVNGQPNQHFYVTPMIHQEIMGLLANYIDYPIGDGRRGNPNEAKKWRKSCGAGTERQNKTPRNHLRIEQNRVVQWTEIFANNFIEYTRTLAFIGQSRKNAENQDETKNDVYVLRMINSGLSHFIGEYNTKVQNANNSRGKIDLQRVIAPNCFALFDLQALLSENRIPNPEPVIVAKANTLALFKKIDQELDVWEPTEEQLVDYPALKLAKDYYTFRIAVTLIINKVEEQKDLDTMVTFPFRIRKRLTEQLGLIRFMKKSANAAEIEEKINTTHQACNDLVLVDQRNLRCGGENGDYKLLNDDHPLDVLNAFDGLGNVQG